MQEERDKKIIESLNVIIGQIESGSELVGNDLLLQFKSNAQACIQELTEIKRTDRVLRIGIVGEIKAGKSSFLNALFFNGEDFLPKAPTPMTAALTKLGYNKEPSAKVVFFSEADWDKIETLSLEYDRKLDSYYSEVCGRINMYGDQIQPMPAMEMVESQFKRTISTELISCKEITRMVDKYALDLNEFLGKTITLTSNLLESLRDYVSADGKMTPLVKHTEVFFNNPVLNGIEIVDTPGLNDPILSRSETTKQFLIKCDVVFLLSYVGQFLTSSDIAFLTKTLPFEGIRHAVLVGSKLDSGVLDHSQRGKCKFMDAYTASVRNFNQQAQKNIDIFMNGTYCSPVILKLKESLPPKYISSLMYRAAMNKRNAKALSAEAQNVITCIQNRFDCFDDSEKGLFGFAGIDRIRNGVLNEVINEKETILQERVATFTQSQVGKFLSMLESININAKQNLSDLKQYDQLELQQKLDMLTEKLDSIRIQVKNQFESSSVDAKKYIKIIEGIISNEVNNHIDFEIKSNTKIEHNTISTGLFGWKKEHYTDTVTIRSADVSEVLANLRTYADKGSIVANSEFSKLFRIDDLKRKISEVVQGAFDLTDKNFNENDILIPLENALKRLTIPAIRIDSEQYGKEILERFSKDVVEGYDISRLRVAQEKALSRMKDEIVDSLEKAGDEIEASLSRQASEFIDRIVHQICDNIAILRKLLNDKEASIRKYGVFINILAECKELLTNVK